MVVSSLLAKTLAYVGLVMEFICWLRKHYHNLKNCTLYLHVTISVDARLAEINFLPVLCENMKISSVSFFIDLRFLESRLDFPSI